MCKQASGYGWVAFLAVLENSPSPWGRLVCLLLFQPRGFPRVLAHVHGSCRAEHWAWLLLYPAGEVFGFTGGYVNVCSSENYQTANAVSGCRCPGLLLEQRCSCTINPVLRRELGAVGGSFASRHLHCSSVQLVRC